MPDYKPNERDVGRAAQRLSEEIGPLLKTVGLAVNCAEIARAMLAVTDPLYPPGVDPKVTAMVMYFATPEDRDDFTTAWRELHPRAITFASS